MRDNGINNRSAFVNDLVIEALRKGDYFKKTELRKINGAQEELRKLGVDVQLVVLDNVKNGKPPTTGLRT